MAHRSNVALLVSHLDNEFSREIIVGANRAAQDFDSNLVIFPVRFVKGDVSDPYCYQHNTLIRYANCRDFDLVIVEAGTIGTFVNDDEMYDILSDFHHAKVLTIAKRVGDFPRMMFNTKGMEEEFDHLVSHHHYRNIGFVSGPLTSDDAVERLEVYKNGLKRHGLEYNPFWVVEGDFSDRSIGVIREFMTAHAMELDAIMFANDKMAMCAYDVAREMGLQVGKDIAFCGFDDIQDAMVCDPPLSTVHADSQALGYQALRDGLLMVEGYKDELLTVDTVFLDRSSCGERNFDAEKLREFENVCTNADFLDLIYNRFISENWDDSGYQQVLTETLAYIREVVELASKNEDFFFDRESMKEKFHQLMLHGILKAISIDELNRLVDYVSTWTKKTCRDPKRFAEIQRLMFSHCKQIVIFNFQQSFTSEAKQRSYLRGMNHLMNSLFLNGFDFLDNTSKSVSDDLDRIGVGDCFIYLHGEDIRISNYEQFRLPYSHRLRLGRNENGVISLEPENQTVNSAFLFSNKFISEKRKTLLVGTLFLAEEHFGILCAEMDPEHYYFFNLSVRPQFSFLVKLYTMQNKQREMMDVLKQTLGDVQIEKNRLDQITKEDTLTGESNLRGLYEAFNKAKDAEENQGKECVMIFCDLNNLKLINDNYGHEEGNYAICKIAESLRSNLPNDAVIARIGGDELVAFAFMKHKTELLFRDSIRRYLSRENMLNGKKYWIESSIGYFEFLMDKALEPGDFVNEADILMYADKKGERKKIQK